MGGWDVLWTGDYITTCVTLNWIVKIACEMPDMNGLQTRNAHINAAF